MSLFCDRVEIVKRLRALTLKLLPMEVDVETLNDPTSRVITPAVISAYAEAAGDFHEAVSSVLGSPSWASWTFELEKRFSLAIFCRDSFRIVF